MGGATSAAAGFFQSWVARSGGRDRTTGMVTAELAVAIPALVIVLAMVLGGVSLGVDQVRCVDAARLAARAVARGDPGSAASALALRAAPSGARVALSSGGGQVTATVGLRREVGGFGFEVSATSVADLEKDP